MDEYYPQDLDDSSGSQSVGEVRSWVERVTRRSLSDVRVHDSGQAGQLARRLGARAFAAGRHVYARPELVKPLTPEGAALLAHEMWHAAGEPAIVTPSAMPHAPSSTLHGGMPLLSSGTHATRSEHGLGGSGAEGVSVQRQAIQAPMPVQRDIVSGAGSEATAQSVEAAALHEQYDRMEASDETAGAQDFDPEEVAEKVYRLFVRELIVDRERTAHEWI